MTVNQPGFPYGGANPPLRTLSPIVVNTRKPWQQVDELEHENLAQPFGGRERLKIAYQIFQKSVKPLNTLLDQKPNYRYTAPYLVTLRDFFARMAESEI